MNEFRQKIDVTLEKLNHYSHQGNFDLYDLEELVFQEFQEIQKRTLGILTNKKLKSKKTRRLPLPKPIQGLAAPHLSLKLA